MNLDELQDILKRGEGQYIEFKSDFPKQAHDLAKEMVAMANTNGGILLMGVTDDGIPVGIENPANAEERLAGIARECKPSLPIELTRISLENGVGIVCAKIPKIICTYKAKFHIRVGSTSVEAGGQDIEELFKQKSNPQDIQLEMDSADIKRVPHNELEDRGSYGNFLRTIQIGIGILSIFGIILIANYNFVLVLIFAIISAIVLLYFELKIITPYFEEIACYNNIPKEVGASNYIGNGKFIRKDFHEYTIHKFTARCIYPYCSENHNGEIVISDTPLGTISRIGEKYYGRCSVCGSQHSYLVDGNHVATRENTDKLFTEKPK